MWGWLLLLWGIYLTECVVSVAFTDAILTGRRVKRFRAARGPHFSRINAEHGWSVLPPSPASLAFVARGERWDTDSIIERVTRFGASTRVLSLLAALLGVALLIVTPLLLVTSRIQAVLLPWLVVLVLLDAAVIVSFVRARRRLQPDDRPLKPLMLAILSPLAAVRLPVTLGMDLLRDVHPIAAIVTLAREDDALAFARRAWFDAPNDRKPLEKALKKRELFRVLLTPPAHTDSTSSAYCPRCHQEYASGATACADCESVALLPFAEPS